MLTLVVAILGCFLFAFSLFKNWKYKKVSLYWIICLITAFILTIINIKDFKDIYGVLIEDSSINPLKIVVFFISMTILSIVLDNLGFFKYIAIKCSKLAKNNQMKLFIIFYVIVSILTIFTSNDIVILSFVPFICYFCKHNKINPLPYVFSTFVAANTWSMFLIIGNPTNVYISSYEEINFLEYLKVMWLPTLVSGVSSFVILWLLFRKQLREKICFSEEENIVINKPLIVVNAIFLIVCTILLSISSYIGLEMWYIALFFVICALIANLIICIIKKYDRGYLKDALKRAPWTFIPFLLSMFIVIMCLNENGIITKIYSLFEKIPYFISYGFVSFIFANIINNIPMTALFSQILANGCSNKIAIYGTIIGSNLGAMFTPLGALAGIMFMNILKEKEIKFSISKFVKYGAIVSIISLPLALLMLYV